MGLCLPGSWQRRSTIKHFVHEAIELLHFSYCFKSEIKNGGQEITPVTSSNPVPAIHKKVHPEWSRLPAIVHEETLLFENPVTPASGLTLHFADRHPLPAGEVSVHEMHNLPGSS